MTKSHNHGRSQAAAQFASIAALVAALSACNDSDDDTADYEGQTLTADEIRESIEQRALSVLVRSGWHEPHRFLDAEAKPAEYEILLCTGGPAVRIVGDLEDGQPTTATLQYQDWFIPWTDTPPAYLSTAADVDPESILLAFAGCFWFGE